MSVTEANAVTAISTSNAEKIFIVKLHAPDVAHDNTKVSQQFYCSKLLNVEYIHEIVRRMRVVNLNVITCLRTLADFERFLSYYNVGNIVNASGVMTCTLGMRDILYIVYSALGANCRTYSCVDSRIFGRTKMNQTAVTSLRYLRLTKF